MVLLWVFYASLAALGAMVAVTEDESLVLCVLLVWSVVWLAIVLRRLEEIEREREVEPDEWWTRVTQRTMARDSGEEIRRSERLKNKRIA